MVTDIHRTKFLLFPRFLCRREAWVLDGMDVREGYFATGGPLEADIVLKATWRSNSPYQQCIYLLIAFSF